MILSPKEDRKEPSAKDDLSQQSFKIRQNPRHQHRLPPVCDYYLLSGSFPCSSMFTSVRLNLGRDVNFLLGFMLFNGKVFVIYDIVADVKGL
jgi:hypothetical protein